MRRYNIILNTIVTTQQTATHMAATSEKKPSLLYSRLSISSKELYTKTHRYYPPNALTMTKSTPLIISARAPPSVYCSLIISCCFFRKTDLLVFSLSKTLFFYEQSLMHTPNYKLMEMTNNTYSSQYNQHYTVYLLLIQYRYILRLTQSTIYTTRRVGTILIVTSQLNF